MNTPTLTRSEAPPIKNFFLDMVKAISLYLLLVPGGTVLILIGSLAAGYLPYSDRPGPGWQDSGIFNLGSVWFLAQWAFLFLGPYCLVYGTGLFFGARLFGLLRAPRWLLAVLGALFAGLPSALLVAGLGWYIALAPFPPLGAGILGLAYGALLLPRYAGWRRERENATWKHWSAMTAVFAPLAFFVLLPTITPFFAPQVRQKQYVLFLRLTPGPEAFQRDVETSELTEEEFDLLNSAGLTGTLKHGISQEVGTGPPHARVVIVLSECPAEPAELRLPDAANLIYVQQKDGWKLLPPDAPTLRATVHLPACDENSNGVSYEIPAAGASGSFTWRALTGSEEK